MREVKIEGEFVKKAALCGFLALKLRALTKVGFPDRTVLKRGGQVFFVEFKRPKETPSAPQRYWRRKLRRFGFRWYVCDSLDKIAEILDYESNIGPR